MGLRSESRRCVWGRRGGCGVVRVLCAEWVRGVRAGRGRSADTIHRNISAGTPFTPAGQLITACAVSFPNSSPATAEPTGIRLRAPWPPPSHISYEELIRDPPRSYRPSPHDSSNDSIRALYAEKVLSIDVGRQLFVDDYLIESTTLSRRWYTARVESLHTLQPDRSWEQGSAGRRTARPFGGASLLDPRTQQVHLYYRCGWRGSSGRTCLALSRDGRTFTKPALSSGGTNVVMEAAANEATEIVYDHIARPPRWVALRNEALPLRDPPFFLPWRQYTSADGISWVVDRASAAAGGVGMMADRSSFFLNPLRKEPVWTFSLRENLCHGGPSGHMRARRYVEQPHAARAPPQRWRPYVHAYFQCERLREGEPVLWAGVDSSDCALRRVRPVCGRRPRVRERDAPRTRGAPQPQALRRACERSQTPRRAPGNSTT